MTFGAMYDSPESDWDPFDDDGPTTEVPNSLLARLVGADHCDHASDYCCHDCMNEAMDQGISLLEGPHWSDPGLT